MGFEEKYWKEHKGASFFGFADGLVYSRAEHDALLIVSCALKRAEDDDLRAEEPFLEALEYLERVTAERSLIARLRRALDVPEPVERASLAQHIAAELVRRRKGNGPALFLPHQN